MQSYENFWLENNVNQPKKKVVVVIKRKKQQPQVKVKVAEVESKKDLIARGPSPFLTSTPVKDQFNFKIEFDPEITASPKWRSQFHYPEGEESSGYMVKDNDYNYRMNV